MAFKKLIYYIIPLVVLILIVMWQFGPEGLFDEMKDAVKGIVEMAPEVTIGAEELAGEKPTVSKEDEEAIRALVNTIEKVKGDVSGDCFVNYGGLGLGEEGMVVELTENTIIVRTLDGKQVVTDLTNELSEKLSGFKPCVIAGEENNKLVAEEFYYKFIEPDEEPHLTYFKSVDKIILTNKKIDYGEGFQDLEDYGWLFSPEEGKVCFFPTYEGDWFGICDADKEGLDNDCLKYLEDMPVFTYCTLY